MEKKLIEKNQNVPFPGWDSVESERRQEEPNILLVVKDQQGNVVRRVEGPVKKGFHRVSWDLRYPASDAIELKEVKKDDEPKGVLASPGEYKVTLSKQIDGKNIELSVSMPFSLTIPVSVFRYRLSGNLVTRLLVDSVIG